jgi:hypothetical protein
MKPIQNRNFDLFSQIIPFEILKELENVKLTSRGFMDLSIEVLEENQGKFKIAMGHYFFQNGDLCPDPDMELTLCPDQKTLTADSITQFYGAYQTAVADGPNGQKVENPKIRQELNQFLRFWLKNLVDQRFCYKTNPFPVQKAS